MHQLARKFTKPVFIPFYFPSGSPKKLFSHFGCGAANVTCGITASGGLITCNFLPLKYRGEENLRKKSISQIWKECESFKVMRTLQGNNTCSSCKYYSLCRGNCRASALYFYKDINAPDLYCFKEE